MNTCPNDPVPTATAQIPLRLQENLQLLDHMYPKTKVKHTHALVRTFTHFHTFFSFFSIKFSPCSRLFCSSLPTSFLALFYTIHPLSRLSILFFFLLSIFFPTTPLCHLHATTSCHSHHSIPTSNTLLSFQYNHIHKVDLLLVQADDFSPELVMQLSIDLKIQPSFMFIRCPGKNFPYNIGDFRGIRTIMQ